MFTTMMETPLSFYLFLLVVIQSFDVNQAESANGVCTKTEGSYEINKSFGTKRNRFNNVVTFSVTTKVTVTKAVSYCCGNYDTITKKPLICKSKCAKPCNNGDCTSEKTCACKKGYVLDPKDKYNCLPRCFESCGKGVCNAPCVCDSGTWNITETALITSNRTCQPCIKPCFNGTCVAPVSCSCLDGYTILEENICEPHCSGDCAHGRCVSPGTCICNPGWYKSYLNDTCVVDGFGNWMRWIYMSVAISILLVLLLTIFIIIRRCKQDKSLKDDHMVIVPAQPSRNCSKSAEGPNAKSQVPGPRKTRILKLKL